MSDHGTAQILFRYWVFPRFIEKDSGVFPVVLVTALNSEFSFSATEYARALDGFMHFTWKGIYAKVKKKATE